MSLSCPVYGLYAIQPLAISANIYPPSMNTLIIVGGGKHVHTCATRGEGLIKIMAMKLAKVIIGFEVEYR